MTLKNGGLDLPVGGSKCGLDIDPHDPEARPMLVRYFRAMRPFFETYVATGEDMGTTQAQLLEVFQEAGMGTPFKSVLAAQDDPDSQLRRTGLAFGVRVDGIDLIDLVGGYGVAEATLAALEHLGLAREAARVVGVREAAFKSRLHQARLKVRASVGDAALAGTALS